MTHSVTAQPVTLDSPLSWREVSLIAEGAELRLSDSALGRIRAARGIVESIVSRGIRAYGVNTGVGSLSDVAVDASKLRQLSRNIVMSHAVGVGHLLNAREVRAIISAAINNYAHGYSGIRPEVVGRLLDFLSMDCIPEVPAGGSVGYLTHMAHISLALLGEGSVRLKGRRLVASEALAALSLQPLTLEAKEGLSLVNGTPCATGLLSVALLRAERLLDWVDLIAAMSFENLGGQRTVFDAASLHLRASPGLLRVGERLRSILRGSERLKRVAGNRTQDALSLRAIPQVHGAARDVFDTTGDVVDRELAAVTDNPMVAGSADSPLVYSEAHAVGAALGLAADSLGVAMAEVAAMSERRHDRLLNSRLSGLPAFLSMDSGVGSGFMIAQYTAVALVNDNRRLAAPASLDGGITSASQEDHLSHATPAALKLHKILDNAQVILAIELLAASQAYDLQEERAARAPGTDRIYAMVRGLVPPYRDDRPLAGDIELARGLLAASPPAGG